MTFLSRFFTLAACGALAVLAARPADAYVYHNIEPYYTTNDVKAVFAGADVEITRWGWQKSYQKVLVIKGAGIDGSVAVFIDDLSETKATRGLDSEAYDALTFPASSLYGYASSGVRWMPSGYPQLSALVDVFGRGYVKKTDSLNFRHYYSWKNGEVVAFLDDRGRISFIEFSYSRTELLNRVRRLVAAAKARDAELASTSVADEDQTEAVTSTDGSLRPSSSNSAESKLRAASHLWNERLVDPDFRKLNKPTRDAMAKDFLQDHVYSIPEFTTISLDWREDVIKRILRLEPLEVGE